MHCLELISNTCLICSIIDWFTSLNYPCCTQNSGLVLTSSWAGSIWTMSCVESVLSLGLYCLWSLLFLFGLDIVLYVCCQILEFIPMSLSRSMKAFCLIHGKVFFILIFVIKLKSSLNMSFTCILGSDKLQVKFELVILFMINSTKPLFVYAQWCYCSNDLNLIMWSHLFIRSNI